MVKEFWVFECNILYQYYIYAVTSIINGVSIFKSTYVIENREYPIQYAHSFCFLLVLPYGLAQSCDVICAYTYTYVYTYAYAFTFTFTQIHIHIHIHIQIHAHTHTHTFISTNVFFVVSSIHACGWFPTNNAFFIIMRVVVPWDMALVFKVWVLQISSK